jgi:hypothetical protein
VPWVDQEPAPVKAEVKGSSSTVASDHKSLSQQPSLLAPHGQAHSSSKGLPTIGGASSNAASTVSMEEFRLAVDVQAYMQSAPPRPQRKESLPRSSMPQVSMTSLCLQPPR